MFLVIAAVGSMAAKGKMSEKKASRKEQSKEVVSVKSKKKNEIVSESESDSDEGGDSGSELSLDTLGDVFSQGSDDEGTSY